jgi:serine/threonine protein kinase
MEYCKGGELLDHLLLNGNYLSHYLIGNLDESKVAIIMKKLFSACDYMHSKGIAHRDLKPENLLLSTEAEDAEIKMIDFGLSKKLR